MESSTVAGERTRATIAIAVWFTAVGGLPLFLVTCYTVTLQAEFGFDAAELGIIVGTYFTGAVTGAQAGFIVDRVSAVVGLRVAGLLSSASGVLIGLAAVLFAACARLLGASAPRAAGALAGLIGQPAILAYAASRVTDERVESGYAALFALGIIAKILLVQVIVL